jgi:hypothetical protein
MEEVLKVLSPWPMAQGVLIGLIIAAGGFWAMRRGLQDNHKRDAETPDTLSVRVQNETVAVTVEMSDEEKRWQWEAYKQIGHLDVNSFAIVHHLEQLVELNRGLLNALNRLADSRWNSGQ